MHISLLFSCDWHVLQEARLLYRLFYTVLLNIRLDILPPSLLLLTLSRDFVSHQCFTVYQHWRSTATSAAALGLLNLNCIQGLNKLLNGNLRTNNIWQKMTKEGKKILPIPGFELQQLYKLRIDHVYMLLPWPRVQSFSHKLML